MWRPSRPSAGKSPAAPQRRHIIAPDAYERGLAQNLGSQRGQAMRSLAEIHRTCRQQHPDPRRDRDHAADARTARSTSVSSVPSMPIATRTTAPASLIVSVRRAPPCWGEMAG